MSRTFLPRRLTVAVFLVALGVCGVCGACGNGDTGGTGGTGAGTGGGDMPWLRASSSWASLYDVYFGPTGVASCSNGDTCHTSLMTSGGIASNFACTDKDACYASLTGLSNLVRMQDVGAPGSAPLLAKIRQKGNTGSMPSNSMFTFAPEDVAVIEAWIGKGAKDD